MLDLGSSPTPLSTWLLLALSKPGPAHQKYIVKRTRVSRSKSPDQQTHFCVVLAPAIYFWWTGRESNPRPEHILLRFIQRYFYLSPAPNRSSCSRHLSHTQHPGSCSLHLGPQILRVYSQLMNRSNIMGILVASPRACRNCHCSHGVSPW